MNESTVHLVQFVLACIAGFLGAAFSMLIAQRGRTQSASFDDMKVMVRLSFARSRACIGVGAGAILYLLLSSGLVTGKPFPEFAKERLAKQQLVSKLVDPIRSRIDSDSTAKKKEIE